ncbi:hypothetical protein [Ferrovibrio sp.]|uniref:hypothetical protein n=1 Tax=Ferrovibrio sp. TaxID=1917215 RepID=UPI0035B18868
MSEAMMPTDWRDQIRALAKDHPRGLAGLADRIGMSRPSLSMLLADKYPGDPARMRAKVMLFLGEGQVSCPYLRQEIADSECRGYRTRPQPTSIPSELRHWTACQACQLGKALATAERKEPSHVA